MTGKKIKKKREDSPETAFAKFLLSDLSADAAAEYEQCWDDYELAGVEAAKLKTKQACVEQTTTVGIDGAEEKADRIAEIQAQIEALQGGHGAEIIRKRREEIAAIEPHKAPVAEVAEYPQIGSVAEVKAEAQQPQKVENAEALPLQASALGELKPGANPAAHPEPNGTQPAHQNKPRKRYLRIGWQETEAFAYVVAVYASIHPASAKELCSVLRKHVTDMTPLYLRRNSFIVRQTGKSLSDKTIENSMSGIRMKAEKLSHESHFPATNKRE